MRALAALGRLRARAESTMTDTCRITKPVAIDDDTYFNPETGEYDEPVADVVYEGKCRIPSTAGAFVTANSREQAFGVGEYPFELPFTDQSVNVAPGMTVEYLTSEHNPMLVGRRFGIVAPLYQSQATKLRFKIKTGVSGGGS